MAIQALLVILAVLLVLLFLGVPISYAIAVSSLTAILSSIDLNVAVLTAAQRTFVGMSKFSLTAIPTLGRCCPAFPSWEPRTSRCTPFRVRRPICSTRSRATPLPPGTPKH